jgi:nucleoside-diphosphate-sugar epimerase
MVTIAMSGASGFIGGHILRQMVEAGHDVVAFGRKFNDKMDNRHVTYVKGDFTQQEIEVFRQERGANLPLIMVHTAGQAHIASNERHKELFEQNNVVLTATMLEIAAKLRIKKFIFLSTISVLSCDSQDIYAQTKRRAEELVKTFCASHQMQYVIIRPVMVYGENDVKGNMAKLIRQLDRGFFPLFNQGKNKKEILYVRNLVAAVAEIIHREDWDNQTLFLKDPATMMMCDICHKITAILGHRCYLLPVPRCMISASVAVVNALQHMGFLANLNANSIRRLGEDVHFVEANDPELERRMLFSSAQGLEQTVLWYLSEKRKCV